MVLQCIQSVSYQWESMVNVSIYGWTIYLMYLCVLQCIMLHYSCILSYLFMGELICINASIMVSSSRISFYLSVLHLCFIYVVRGHFIYGLWSICFYLFHIYGIDSSVQWFNKGLIYLFCINVFICASMYLSMICFYPMFHLWVLSMVNGRFNLFNNINVSPRISYYLFNLYFNVVFYGLCAVWSI